MTDVTESPPLIALEPDECIEMYRQMVLIRHFEELALKLRLEDRIHGVVHPYSGQEAIAVGVCANLRVTDRIVSNHRGHGHCIAKGADINRMMAELFGRRTGYCKGKGGSMHIADFDAGMLGANGIVGAGLADHRPALASPPSSKAVTPSRSASSATARPARARSTSRSTSRRC